MLQVQKSETLLECRLVVIPTIAACRSLADVSFSFGEVNQSMITSCESVLNSVGLQIDFTSLMINR